MSKQEFLKIQTCVLKVNIHCEGCKQKVKKTLHKIEGVYTIAIDAELGKVTVSGNVDAATLIKKLNKNGKFAEIWGAPKPSNVNSNNQMFNQLKNLQIGNGNNKNQSKKGQMNPQIMKGFQDLKNHVPQMKAPGNDKDQKSVKFTLPEEEDLSGDDDDFESDDEFDDYEDDSDDDEFEDEVDPPPVNKMKPLTGNTPQMIMKNMMNAQQAAKKGGPGNAGGGNIPIQFNFAAGNGKINDGGGKKGGGENPNKGGPPPGNKNNRPSDGIPNKNGSGGGGGGSGNGGGAPNFMSNNGSKKSMNDGPHGMPNIMPMNAPAGMMNMAMPHPQINQIPNLKSFPTGDQITGNPYHQQQQYAAMMNAQRSAGNERFQPMVYARPPPAISYMPTSSYPPQSPYPYYQAPRYSDRGDDYAMFSDENTQSCRIM